MTRFLEGHPLDPQAPLIRARLLQWEDGSADVRDVVCPGVFSPLPDDAIKYNGELLAQFIFGSAAHQLSNRADKGKLMPAQLAGMKSMLKTYRALLAVDRDARIARFDELSRDEVDGSLLQVLEPLVIANCLPEKTGESRFPWAFGMTHKQVLTVDAYGPYRSFKNGDLETYNAVFDGHFQNFQFYFKNDRLHRISIVIYEGPDLIAAGNAWGKLYDAMKRNLGRIETPENAPPVTANPASMKTFIAKAQALVKSGGKAQMAPMKQPTDAFSFASFGSYEVQGTKMYHATIYFDRPTARSKDGSSAR